MNYRQKLLDPRWQKKRLKILERDEFTCRMCGADDITLHVHHKRYRYGADPWDITDDALVTLCEGCHENESEVSGALSDLRAVAADKFSSDEIYYLTIAIYDGPESFWGRSPLTGPDFYRLLPARKIKRIVSSGLRSVWGLH